MLAWDNVFPESASQHQLARYVFATLARRIMTQTQSHNTVNHLNVAIATNSVYFHNTMSGRAQPRAAGGLGLNLHILLLADPFMGVAREHGV